MFSLDALFCDVDDFCVEFEPQWRTKLLHHQGIKRIRAKSLCLSEIMTILTKYRTKIVESGKNHHVLNLNR
ncbi:putative transposase [Stanieria sp. NIES-3757]|nr:putative transposase [Stanieria sp. NIES-3757]